MIADAGTNFTYSFPPCSMTLLTLAPAAPRLAVTATASPGQYVFQLQGQPDVRYLIQCSTNLTSWIPVATNTLAGTTSNLTNALRGDNPLKFSLCPLRVCRRVRSQ